MNSHLLEQFVLIAGLRDEIISPALKGCQALVIHGASGQTNDDSFLSPRIGLDPSSRLQPVHDRHMHIHQDQPWVPFLPASDGGLAVFHTLHGKAQNPE